MPHRWSSALVVLALTGLALLSASRPGHSAPAAPLHAAVRDSAVQLDVNEIGLRTSNFGSFVSFYGGGAFSGLEWPRGSGRTAVFTAGLWVGARVAGDTLVTVAEYSSEFAPGPLDASGAPLDPTESDPRQRVYSIRRCDDARRNADWAAWPAAFGAPVDANGDPRLLGDQTLWSVYNDAVASQRRNPVGSTAPLGIEVHQTVFGFARGGDLDRVVFLIFDITNGGTKHLDEAYVGLWADADLGGAEDDLVGCDTTLDLGYTYNGDDSDLVYGVHPPAVGCALLQGPVVAGDTLRMTSFGRLLKDSNEPTNHGMAYRRMALGVADPGGVPPFACEPAGTRFECSGDPVSRVGCRDASPADRRMLLGSGPFTLAPGDSQRVVALLAIGGRPDEGDRLSNLSLLRATAAEARAVYRSGFTAVPPLPPCGAPLRVISALPNPSLDAPRLEIEVPAGVASLAVHIHDATGRTVWKRSLTDLRPGTRFLEWDGRAGDGGMLPTGIYFVQVEGGGQRAAGRIVRLR